MQLSKSDLAASDGGAPRIKSQWIRNPLVHHENSAINPHADLNAETLEAGVGNYGATHKHNLVRDNP